MFDRVINMPLKWVDPGKNKFHNILKLFDVLTNFPFTTSEAMCNYYL